MGAKLGLFLETFEAENPQTHTHTHTHVRARVHIYWGKLRNMVRCITSYQEVLNSLLTNVNHQADEAVLCNHSINGQLLSTSVLTGRLCFGAL